MEVMEDSVVAPAPGPASTLRLRPVKTSREVSPEQAEHLIPNTSYLEETWEDEPMSPAGRMFTEMSSTVATKMCIVCILGFKYPIDRKKFKSHVEMSIMKHKRFSSRVEIRQGRPWWTQVKTNVDNHVFEADLTPEQKVDTDSVLNYTTDVLLPKPFDESRPLWDMHLVDAKVGEAKGCCIIRIHHALGDGTSLISLLMACTRSVDKPDMLPSFTTDGQDKRMSSRPVNTSSFMSKLYAGIWKYLLMFWCSLIEIGKAGATLMWLKDSPTAIKGFAGVEHLPRKYRFVTLKVEDFKYISKTLGVTINDVFMTIASYGLRQYLEHRALKDASEEAISTTEKQVTEDKTAGDDAVKSAMSKKLEADGLEQRLDSVRLRALALINVRSSPGLQELSEMMNGQSSQARWGNHMGYLLIPLPMKHYSDSLELLQLVKTIGDRKKRSLEGAFSYSSGEMVMRLCGQKTAADVVYRVTLQTSISLSNVKGPTEHVMFADNPLTHIIPSVVGHPHSLTLHLQSYNGEVAIVAMATKKLIPDPEYLLELCIDGLEEIKKAAMGLEAKK